MKQLYFVFTLLSFSLVSVAQQPYYNGTDISLTGDALYQELQGLISVVQGFNTYTYGDVRDSYTDGFVDADPDNPNNVLLIYGFDNNDGNCITDRTRSNNDFGGNSCDFNREHVFARSNANPPMGDVNNSTVGIAADPHNLRPSDVQQNGNRGNRRFADGSGNAGTRPNNTWYPGDEWKGDVARMMMYMFTRYGDRCLPILNGSGTTEGTTDMLQIYLQWNVDDPVSSVEDDKNNFLEAAYGNRNPFVDNPVFATQIWGGPTAQDRFNTLSNTEFDKDIFKLFPNPVQETLAIDINFNEEISLEIFNLLGQKVMQNTIIEDTVLDVSNLQDGIYMITMVSGNNRSTKKLIKQ